MKKLLTLFSLISIFIGVNAQSNKEDIDIIQAVYGKEKKELVNAYMNLAPEKAKAFWTVYDQFETKRKQIGLERIKVLEQYANNIGQLTNEVATEVMNKGIANEAKFPALYKEFFPKFTTATSALEAAKFMQLEFYLQSVVRARIQEEVPLIGELDKTAKD